MARRNSKLPAVGANSSSNQPLTHVANANRSHRPARGLQYPNHGTMDAPFIVIGATGTIGSAVVRELVESGSPVVAVAPRPERLSQLGEGSRPGAVIPLAGCIETEADAERLADQLRALARPIAGVIVAFPHGRSADATTERRRLIDQPTTALSDCLWQTVLAQHALARHLIPMLAEAGRNARYLIVGGPGSETPWAGYGHRSIAMAATRMLARVLHDEARPAGVRVQLVSIDSPMRSEQPRAHECPEWPTASDVARRVMRLLDRDATDEPADAVIACTRGGIAGSVRRWSRTFSDVPSFLESLRNSSK
ncbi:MAG TPA: SDR family oxidoreductase [Steroidobacteraceae bacterium]